MSQPGATDRPPIPHAACSSSRLKGASWSTHSVLGRLRKSFVCLRAHSALKQTNDFETAPGTAGATTQGGEHCFPRREPGWKRPHATLKAVAFSPLLSRQCICPCRSPTRDEIAGRPRSALRLPCAKSVAVTTVALRTGEFWKRLLRQGEAVRSGSPEQGVCQPPTVVLDNSGTDRALCAVLSRQSPPRGGISPQPASDHLSDHPRATGGS